MHKTYLTLTANFFGLYEELPGALRYVSQRTNGKRHPGPVMARISLLDFKLSLGGYLAVATFAVCPFLKALMFIVHCL
jgi:hypothetical protein